jgi:hypothetical protein
MLFFKSSETYLQIFVVFKNFIISMYSVISRGIFNDVSQNRKVPRKSWWEELSRPMTMGVIVEGTESNNTHSSESICPCCMF